MEIFKPTINDFGGAPFAEHNMPCAICRDEKAVLDLSCGIFRPCWTCQKDGFDIGLFDGWRKWLKNLFTN